MNEQEIQQYFEQNGFYPTRPDSRPPRPSRVITPAKNASNLGRSGHLAPRGWRASLHWQAPPAFGNPGQMYQLLGHEAYCEAVKAYWEVFGLAGLEQARRLYDRWVVRQVLRTFGTHVRGFRRQDVSGRRNIGKGGGGVFAISVAADNPMNEITLPEDLVKDGRLVRDLRAWLKAYGAQDLDATEQRVKAQITATWGIKVA